MKKIQACFALVATSAVVLAAEPPPMHAVSPAPADARVYIIEPLDGATVPQTFTVKFGVEGIDIAPAGTDQPHSGHHHLLVDIATLPDLTVPLPANEHILHFGKGQTETQLTLAPGSHTLQLVFANYLHIAQKPALVSKRITVTVK